MSLNIDALAREIADALHPGIAAHANLHVRETAREILHRHLPAPTVVEVTGDDMSDSDEVYRDNDAYYSTYSTISQRRAAFINARLRARAGATDTIPVRVIRRPTETVSALVVPEDGLYARRFDDGSVGPISFHYNEGERPTPDTAAIRRIDTDAPTTWIERTTTQQPRAWQAGDVPKGVIVTYALGAHAYFATYPRADIAVFLNRQNAPYILVLPERVP